MQFYHLQVIRWQAEYGAVPGIANLYPRLGLGSNWFNIISFFYLPDLKSENFTYLNAALVSWFFLWLFSTWRYYFQQFNTNNSSRVLGIFYFFILLYSLFDWQVFRDAANSTSYDFVVNSFIILVFSFFIEGVLNNHNRDRFSMIVLLFSLSIVSFKFSGIFILILILYHIITTRKTVNWPLIITVGLLILLPVLIKNYINTGYPLFPATLTINTPDWQFPKEMADRFYRYIILSNKFYNSQWSFIDNFPHTTFNWIPIWFTGILWKHKIILSLAILSGLFLFIKTRLPINHRVLRHLILILFLMIFFWFFTAPDPGRFGYGVLLTASFLTLSIIFYRFVPGKILNPALLLTSIIICFYIFKKSEPLINNPINLLFPITSDVPAYKTITIRKTEIHLPDIINENWDHRCYFTPLPCITQKNPYLQPRGSTINDGFRMVPYPDSNFIRNYEY